METKELNINPVSKIKRILIHFADLLLTFIIGFTIVNTVVFPIGNKIIKLEDNIRLANQYHQERLNILYDNNLLFYDDASNKYELNQSMQFTFDRYLEDCVYNIGANNAVDNYFLNIINDKSLYLESYQLADADYGFFAIGNEVNLKDEYKTLFQPYFSSTDSLSKLGSEKIEIFKNKIFTNLYNFILKDISAKDLTATGTASSNSFNQVTLLLNNINNKISYYFSIGTIIGYLIAIIFYFILFPCFFGNRRTIGMVLMRVQLLNKNTLDVRSRASLSINSLVAIPANMGLILFMPSITTGFEEIFSLPLLIPLVIIGILFVITSLIFMLFNTYNQSLSDYISNSVIISSDDFDSIIYERTTKH